MLSDGPWSLVDHKYTLPVLVLGLRPIVNTTGGHWWWSVASGQ